MVKCGKIFSKFDLIQNYILILNYLIGTYECTIDVKGRIMIPIALKKQLLGVEGKGFVLKRAVFQQCLELYPISQWEQLITKVNSLNRFKKKNNDFIRRFTAGVKFIELDTSGRLLIPRDLIDFANIKQGLIKYQNTFLNRQQLFEFIKNFLLCANFFHNLSEIKGIIG